MKIRNQINDNFKLYHNEGNKKKKVLGKVFNMSVPIPRINRALLEKFSSVDRGHVRAIWSDQASYLGTKDLRNSVGYACLLTWENISLGLVGHFDTWSQTDASIVLPALENWIGNLIKYKGVDPHKIKSSITWLINGIQTRKIPEHNVSLMGELQKSLASWAAVWSPLATHTRFVCSQAASGFLLNTNAKDGNEYLSFVWPSDEKKIKVDITPDESFILKHDEKTWVSQRLEELTRVWLGWGRK